MVNKITEINARKRRLFFRLLRTSDRFEAYVNKKLRAYGSNRARFDVISALEANGGSMNPTMIARKVNRSKGNITSVVDTLEQQGFIKRKYSRLERRSVTIYLTKEGKEHLRKYHPYGEDLIIELMSTLNSKQTEQLYSLLKIIRDRLDEVDS